MSYSAIYAWNISTKGILRRLESTEILFRPELRSGPRGGGAHYAPQTPSQLGRGTLFYPSPFHPLDATSNDEI